MDSNRTLLSDYLENLEELETPSESLEHWNFFLEVSIQLELCP